MLNFLNSAQKLFFIPFLIHHFSSFFIPSLLSFPLTVQAPLLGLGLMLRAYVCMFLGDKVALICYRYIDLTHSFSF